MLLDAGCDVGLPLLQLARFFVVFVLRNSPALRAFRLFVSQAVRTDSADSAGPRGQVEPGTVQREIV
jgi:hypothetical protein